MTVLQMQPKVTQPRLANQASYTPPDQAPWCSPLQPLFFPPDKIKLIHFTK